VANHRHGGSTISPACCQDLFLSTKRTPWRKGEEVLITVMLKQVWTKRRIFEIYLNVIEWAQRRVRRGSGRAPLLPHQMRPDLNAEQAAKLAQWCPTRAINDTHARHAGLLRKTGQSFLAGMNDA